MERNVFISVFPLSNSCGKTRDCISFITTCISALSTVIGLNYQCKPRRRKKDDIAPKKAEAKGLQNYKANIHPPRSEAKNDQGTIWITPGLAKEGCLLFNMNFGLTVISTAINSQNQQTVPLFSPVSHNIISPPN